MSDYYVLDADGNPQEEPDVLKWAAWFESTFHPHANAGIRQIAQTNVPGGYVVTSFLGTDHNFSACMYDPNDRRAMPILWETMAKIGGVWGDEQERYQNKEEALIGHAEMVERFGGKA